MAARGAAIAAARRAAAATGDDEQLADRMHAGIGAVADTQRKVFVEGNTFQRARQTEHGSAAGAATARLAVPAVSMAQLSPRTSQLEERRKTFKEIAMEPSLPLQARLPQFLTEQGQAPRKHVAGNLSDDGGHYDDTGSVGSSTGSRKLRSDGSSSSYGSVEYACTSLERGCPWLCARGEANGSWLRARRAVLKLTTSRPFKNTILFCILANTVTLAMSNPLDDDSQQARILELFELVFTFVFAAEMLLKFVALVSIIVSR